MNIFSCDSNSCEKLLEKPSFEGNFSIQLGNTDLCVSADDKNTLILDRCGKQPNQIWHTSDKLEIVSNQFQCLRVDSMYDAVLSNCQERGQKWIFDDDVNEDNDYNDEDKISIFNVFSRLYLTVANAVIGAPITMARGSKQHFLMWDVILL